MKLLIIAALVLVPITAAAQKRPPPKPVKAQFLCGTFVDGKIKQPITGGRVQKLTDPIACAIHMDDPKEPAHMGNVHTVRYVKGAKKPVTSSGSTNDFGPGSEKQDFEVEMKPSSNDLNGDLWWKPCEDFDIVATISDDLGVYFTKTIKVQQSCPAPKPIVAALTCTYEADDGTLFRWPGNGAKLRPRLETYSHELACQVGSKGALPTDSTFTGAVAVKGKTTRTSGTRPTPDKGWAAEVSFDDLDSCADITLNGTLTDANGVTRWSGSLKITQDCPD